MDRVILHSDLNNFYATVECARNPALAGKPVIVCGDPSLRHGIVLAKNYIAKEYGIKTGDVIWEARAKCADVVVVPADFKAYLLMSQKVKDIYYSFTDQIEPFGIDECWLDVTGSLKLFGGAEAIANAIRERVKAELGLTVSIGVSFNKIFAKLGSDMKKPDAVTVIDRARIGVVHALPIEDLLYVGKKTAPKLRKLGMRTIGDLAKFPVGLLERMLGKWGNTLHRFANGDDMSEVAEYGQATDMQSIGNSTTAARNLVCFDDVLMMATVMAESVAERMREARVVGRTVTLHVRTSKLDNWGKQCKLGQDICTATDIIKVAVKLFESYQRENVGPLSLRSVGVKMSDLSTMGLSFQDDLFSRDRIKNEFAEKAVDEIRHRFGHNAIMRANLLLDRKLTNLNPKEENTIFPHSYF